jgi:glucose 1-dehydrogenase
MSGSSAPALPPQKILAGQKALVTGAHWASDGAWQSPLGQAGADVVVNYVGGEDAAHTVVDEARRSGARASAHQADMSSVGYAH